MVQVVPTPAPSVAALKVTEVAPGVAVNVPAPQLVREAPAGFAMTTLPGRASVRLICISALFGSVLTMLMVSWLLCPAQTVAGLKFLFTEGGRTVLTCRVALAGVVLATRPPLPVAVELPAGMVLIRLPAVVEVTATVTVQEPFVLPTLAGTVPPLRERLVAPGTALTVPPQVLDRFTGLARLMPGWTPTRLSLQAALVSWNTFGL